MYLYLYLYFKPLRVIRQSGNITQLVIVILHPHPVSNTRTQYSTPRNKPPPIHHKSKSLHSSQRSVGLAPCLRPPPHACLYQAGRTDGPDWHEYRSSQALGAAAVAYCIGIIGVGQRYVNSAPPHTATVHTLAAPS